MKDNMNKQKRKEIETELSILINSALGKKNELAAAASSKQIKEGVKDIAKKFVKNLQTQKKSLEKSKKTQLKRVPGNTAAKEKTGSGTRVKSKSVPMRKVKKAKTSGTSEKRAKPTTRKK